MGFQDRVLLSLEDDSSFIKLKSIFKSPLGLVEKLVKASFTTDQDEGLLAYEKELDSIKSVVAGIARANSLSASYKVAKFYSYMFAFQQFFHSSYRARQGMPLEAVIYYSIESTDATPIRTTREAKNQVKLLFGISRNVGYDIDIFATKSDNVLVGQIRSTDVTGGTTAKGSLVDLLRFILREKTRDPIATYLIIIWDPLESQQKTSLINKIWDSLRAQLGPSNEARFKSNVTNGWQIPNSRLSIKLIYGTNELGDELNNFCGGNTAKTSLVRLWDEAQKWDDLWLSYAITSLELEKLILEGTTNFQILDNKLQSLDITISTRDLSDYQERSKVFAQQIAPEWDSSLPVRTPSEILNYIRDLILLKMIHLKVSR